jgi:YVTN family beta-propeller protein
MLVALCVLGVAGASGRNAVLLPSGWTLWAPNEAVATLGTMPQGIAMSPDGSELAVVESGVNPPRLHLVSVPSFRKSSIPLPGAFGKPVWIDANHVAVAGADAGAVLLVDIAHKNVEPVQTLPGSWPVAIARLRDGTFAVADDIGGTVSINGTLVHVGDHPADLALSADGTTLYASVRGPSTVVAIDVASHAIVSTIKTGLHPGALAMSADGTTLYVAESDDDTIGVIDTRTHSVSGHISVALHQDGTIGQGSSPNALLLSGQDIYVSLGAENAVGVIHRGTLVRRIPSGWYPTGLAAGGDGTLYVLNGRGEGSPPNPQFNPFRRDSPGYVGSITTGSLRAIPAADLPNSSGENTNPGVPEWTAPTRTVLRADGPIRHVIYIIKENRSYDQVLGDIPGADGDPKLVSFGAQFTPNQHALAKRFGIFDNAFTDAQVSANGHNWTDAAFANDYVERFWPPNYGDRRDLYDFQNGNGPDVPHNGYLWDAAKRAGITYRDYGEDIDFANRLKLPVNTHPGLAGHFDPRFVGWDLQTSDDARLAEWTREFHAFVAHDNLPRLEIVYLPNDHTAGTRPGWSTPQAYVAINDYAVGRLLQTVSHSRYWRSTAVFILEDDAQNGPDHVGAQRSTFYIASPYARGGVQHAHYSTSSFVHTIELLLGLRPLSNYDATALPLYAAFTAVPVNLAPFTAVKPATDMRAVNSRAAYGSAISARLDFTHPDAVDPQLLNRLIERSARR